MREEWEKNRLQPGMYDRVYSGQRQLEGKPLTPLKIRYIGSFVEDKDIKIARNRHRKGMPDVPIGYYQRD